MLKQSVLMQFIKEIRSAICAAVLINWLADFDSFAHVIGELSKG
jgi:hypothetical protein